MHDKLKLHISFVLPVGNLEYTSIYYIYLSIYSVFLFAIYLCISITDDFTVLLSSDQMFHTVILWCSRLVYVFIVFSDDFCIGLVISPRVAVLAWGELGQYGNHHVMIYLLINHSIWSYNEYS